MTNKFLSFLSPLIKGNVSLDSFLTGDFLAVQSSFQESPRADIHDPVIVKFLDEPDSSVASARGIVQTSLKPNTPYVMGFTASCTQGLKINTCQLGGVKNTEDPAVGMGMIFNINGSAFGEVDSSMGDVFVYVFFDTKYGDSGFHSFNFVVKKDSQQPAMLTLSDFVLYELHRFDYYLQLSLTPTIPDSGITTVYATVGGSTVHASESYLPKILSYAAFDGVTKKWKDLAIPLKKKPDGTLTSDWFNLSGLTRKVEDPSLIIGDIIDPSIKLAALFIFYKSIGQDTTDIQRLKGVPLDSYKGISFQLKIAPPGDGNGKFVSPTGVSLDPVMVPVVRSFRKGKKAINHISLILPAPHYDLLEADQITMFFSDYLAIDMNNLEKPLISKPGFRPQQLKKMSFIIASIFTDKNPDKISDNFDGYNDNKTQDDIYDFHIKFLEDYTDFIASQTRFIKAIGANALFSNPFYFYTDKSTGNPVSIADLLLTAGISHLRFTGYGSYLLLSYNNTGERFDSARLNFYLSPAGGEDYLTKELLGEGDLRNYANDPSGRFRFLIMATDLNDDANRGIHFEFENQASDPFIGKYVKWYQDRIGAPANQLPPSGKLQFRRIKDDPDDTGFFDLAKPGTSIARPKEADILQDKVTEKSGRIWYWSVMVYAQQIANTWKYASSVLEETLTGSAKPLPPGFESHNLVTYTAPSLKRDPAGLKSSFPVPVEYYYHANLSHSYGKLYGTEPYTLCKYQVFNMVCLHDDLYGGSGGFLSMIHTPFYTDYAKALTLVPQTNLDKTTVPASKVPAKLALGVILAPNPDHILKMLLWASRGCTSYLPYLYGESVLFNNMFGHSDTYASTFRMFARGNDLLAKAEKNIAGKTAEKAKIAFLVPQTETIWETKTYENNMFGAYLDDPWVHRIFRDLQYPVDFLFEEDIAENPTLLRGYKILYANARYLRDAAFENILSWIRNGGQLIRGWKGITHNEYAQKVPGRFAYLGVKPISVPAGRTLKVKTGIATGDISIPDGSGLTALILKPGTITLNQFLYDTNPGKVAIAEVKEGAGSVIAVGFELGMAYKNGEIVTTNFPAHSQKSILRFTEDNIIRGATKRLVSVLPFTSLQAPLPSHYTFSGMEVVVMGKPGPASTGAVIIINFRGREATTREIDPYTGQWVREPQPYNFVIPALPKGTILRFLTTGKTYTLTFNSPPGNRVKIYLSDYEIITWETP